MLFTYRTDVITDFWVCAQKCEHSFKISYAIKLKCAYYFLHTSSELCNHVEKKRKEKKRARTLQFPKVVAQIALHAQGDLF